MQNAILAAIEKEFTQRPIPDFRVGDTLDVHVKIKEGEKERIQVFAGSVIARRGEGPRATFTVRRIVQGEGVERVFPLFSPRIAKIKVSRGGHVRRAKLFYLREREGKSTRVEERRLEAGGFHETPPEAVGKVAVVEKKADAKGGKPIAKVAKKK